jgi:NAD(P)-dependent dehydrogenase (short-subunit alcohol dehydrogenase family)
MVASSTRLPPLFSLKGKHALVTGGAHGLGRMIAEALLSAGASVIVTSRKAEVAQTAAEAMSAVGDCAAAASDLSSLDSVAELAAQVRCLRPSLDILVNNAGRTWSAPIESFPDSAWSKVLAVNLHAPFKLAQELLPALAASATRDDPSRIINIGSVAGAVVEPLQAYSYSASKAAVHQLTRQLAADLAARNITVNAVLPGYFPTSMTAHLRAGDDTPRGMLKGRIPLGRLGRADDIAGAVIFLASRAGAYVTGTELVVDGGVSGCR